MEHDGCEGCKYEVCAVDSEECAGCIYNAIDKYEPMTNADRIRNMTDEELATIFCTHNWTLAQYSECLAWLKSEAKE